MRMKNFTLKVLIIGFAVFATRNLSAQIVDLTGISNPNILVDTLPDIPNGAVVKLKPGMMYNAGGHAFSKSVTLQSGDPSKAKPLIDCAVNFNFTADAKVDSIIFKNIEIFGTYNDRYFINSNVAATIGEIRLESCLVHRLRGVLRMKDVGPGKLEKYSIVNCVVDSIRDYGILTVDMNNWVCNNIYIKNSTLSRIRAFITNKSNSNSVVIDACTVHAVPAAAQRLFRWREVGQDNVTGGINIKNTLWGPGWDETNTGSTAYDGYDGLAATTWKIENTYSTKDLAFAVGKDTIKALLAQQYSGTSTALWISPGTGDFHFLDTKFTGIGKAGDPRWATTTAISQLDINVNEVNIYPNPASDKVYIDFNQPIQVAVYNIAGSMLKSKLIQSKYDYISVGDLQPGVYLIRSQNDNTFAKKLIKR